MSQNEEVQFPSDELICKNMEDGNNFKHYKFNMADIDKKIKVSQRTKNGQQLYLYRKRIVTKRLGNTNSIDSHTAYYIVNDSGEVVGRVTAKVIASDSLEVDYFLENKAQGQGIGTVVLEQIVKQIYEEKDFDNLEYSSSNHPVVTKTSIKKIELSINEDNEPSKRIAIKNGFRNTMPNYPNCYSLTLDDYNEMNSEKE